MRVSFLAALLLPALLVQAQDDPQVTLNRFENLPARLFFFDDATVRPNICTSRDAPELYLLRMSHTMISSAATSSCPMMRAKVGKDQKIYPKGKLQCS
jgi:hypothetical protein